MAQILVTPKELRATATALREKNANFSNLVKQLESSESSLNSQWSGPSHDAFHNSFMKDKAYMEEFSAVIEQYCQNLEVAAMKYEEVEYKNIDLFNTNSN